LRRSRIDIVTEILHAASGGICKTALVSRTNLNFNIMDRYLRILTKKGLITIAKNSPKITITEKGMKFLEISSRLRELENPTTDMAGGLPRNGGMRDPHP